MKILLSLAVCKPDKRTESLYDGIELLYPQEDESEKEFLIRAIKVAKGKYTVICDRNFAFADVQPLLNIIDKNTADMVCFTNGAAIKTSVLKTVAKDCTDSFSCRVLGVLACKNLLKTIYNPFRFEKVSGKFTDENITAFLRSAEAFGKVKAKLNKEIYSYASTLLCERFVVFYMYAMIAIKEGDFEADKLIEFDNKLKAEIVLYLNLEQKFTAAKLSVLRGKGFKISGLKARKFRKLLK